jgi:hypothetical protein
MTAKELKNILEAYPDDCIITYRHNKYGRIDVDKVEYREEQLLSGNMIHTLTFEATFEED